MRYDVPHDRATAASVQLTVKELNQIGVFKADRKNQDSHPGL